MNLEIDGRVLRHKLEEISAAYQEGHAKAIQMVNKVQIDELDKIVIPQLDKFQSLTKEILKLAPISEQISKLGNNILDDISLSIKLTKSFENYLDSAISELEQRVIIILELIYIQYDDL